MNIKFTGPNTGDLMKAFMAAAEKTISEKVRSAAAPYGVVQIRFKRNTSGALQTVELSGPDKAVEAARKALAQ